MKKISAFIKPYEEIIKEFEFNLRSLSDTTQYLEDLVLEDKDISSAGYYYTESMQLGEVIALNKKLESELNRKFVMELTGAFEAKTVYYLKHVLKRNSEMGKKIPAAVRSGGKHLMYQLIIPIFKDHVQPKNNIVYSEFKNLVEYRNWLAHGRGWDLKSLWSKFNFRYSWQVISSLFELIPDYPESLKS